MQLAVAATRPPLTWIFRSLGRRVVLAGGDICFRGATRASGPISSPVGPPCERTLASESRIPVSVRWSHGLGGVTP